MNVWDNKSTDSMPKPGPAPAMEPEQAADLAALAAAAQGDPAAAPDAQQAQQTSNEPQPPSAAALQIAAMAVGILRPLAAYAVPSLKNAPDELWAPVPEGLAAVLDHYGASAEWMQSPWARLGLSLTPLLAFAAVESMKEAKQKPKAETITASVAPPPPAPDAAPADTPAYTVSFGTSAVTP